MANQNNENNQILNNRPPNVTEDFGIIDDEDKLSKIYMPDKSTEQNKTIKKEKHR